MQDIWKILTITDGYVFTYNPYEITTVCYFPPIILQDENVLANQIKMFIETFFLMAPGSTVSVYLVKQSKDTDLNFRADSKHEILNYLEGKRIEAINNYNSPEYHTYISITMPVDTEKIKTGKAQSPLDLLKTPDYKLILADKVFERNCKETIESIGDTISQLKTKFNGQCFRLGSKTLANFIGLLNNHNTTTNLTDLSSLITSDYFSNPESSVTHYGGSYHSTLSLRSKSYPNTADFRFPAIYFKEELKDTPFIVKATMSFCDPSKAKKQANAMISMIKTYSGFKIFRSMLRELLLAEENMSMALDSIEIENGRLLDFSYQILTWGDTKDASDKNSRLIKNVFNGNDMDLTVDTYNHKATYHSMMPFLHSINKIRTRITSMNAEVFLPIVYPAYYVNEPEKELKVRTLMYTGHNVLTEFDLMDPRDPSWNGIVCGGSGSGKSFLANRLISGALFGNTKVFIIDKGGPGQGSFRNIVTNLPGGRYIEMKWRGDVEFSINFFDGPLFVKDIEGKDVVPDINGVADVEKETFLIQVLTLLTQDDSGIRHTKSLEAKLSEAIRQVYLETNNNAGNELDLNYFATEILSQRFPELYEQISKYIDNGVYARFFQKTTAIPETDIFCFDLEGMDDHPDLAPIMMMVITRFCYNMCMNNPGYRKMIVIDEAWSALGTPALRTTVENIWRTIRKHGGYIYCITQSFRDIFNSEIGTALLSNTTHYYMIGSNHEWEFVRQLKASGAYTNTLSEYDYNLIANMKFVKGEYAEFYMLSPIHKGVLRYRASQEDYWMSTTNADDKALLETKKRELGQTHLSKDVLEAIIKAE